MWQISLGGGGNSLNSINNNDNDVFVPGGQDDYDEFNINYSEEANKDPTKAQKDVFVLIQRLIMMEVDLQSLFGLHVT